ncbi:MAG: DUF2306 domain-containing protein [Wenzhouxiangellaceae bacterium]
MTRAATAWFLIAMVGQLAFVAFILGYYGTRTVVGDFPAWNDKPVITGYIAGDALGNLMFIAHVMLAAVVTLGGLAQLIPAIRQRAPALHRWNGRIFLSVAMFMGVGGLWLIWVRGTQLSLVSSLPTSINGLLIVLFAVLAWRDALARQFARHRRNAMRAFMVVAGVWFFRVGIMGWLILNQGPVGMTDDMSGPADISLAYGSYLIPLAILELYFIAQRKKDAAWNFIAISVLVLATLFTAVGVFGTTTMMWWPYLSAV